MPHPMHENFEKAKAKKGVYENKERFVKLTFQMLNSRAWQFLSPISVRVYVEICRRYNGGNNGKIAMSHNECAANIKAGKQTVNRAVRQLIEHGFIKIVKKGYFTGRQATEYAITDFHLDGHPPTREWKSWNTPKKHRRRQIPNIGIQAILSGG